MSSDPQPTDRVPDSELEPDIETKNESDSDLDILDSKIIENVNEPLPTDNNPKPASFRERRMRGTSDATSLSAMSAASNQSHSPSRPTSGGSRRSQKYSKGDVIMTAQSMAVIRTIRYHDGNEEYGITMPGKTTKMRYISKSRINRRISPEDMITRVTFLTKALEETHSDMNDKQKQIKVLTNQLSNITHQNKTLKQRMSDSSTSRSSTNKKIKVLEQSVKRFQRENRQYKNDIISLRKRTPATQAYQKQLLESKKQNNKSKKLVSELEKQLNQLKTKLHHEKNRARKQGEVDIHRMEGEVAKWKRESEKQKHERVKKEQEVNQLRNRLNKKGRYGHDRRLSLEDQIQRQEKMIQRKVERLRVEQAKLKTKEHDLENQGLRSAHRAQRHMKTAQRVQAEKIEEAENLRKRLTSERRQNKAEKERLKKFEEELERQRKLLARQKNRTQLIHTPNIKRHEWRRQQKAKVIVHTKYLKKDYLQSVIKWRKKRETVRNTNNKLKIYDDIIVRPQKRLQELERLINKDGNKSRKNSNSKSNPTVVKQYLDVLDELQAIEDDFNDELLKMHSNGEELQQLQYELLERENEINDLQNENDSLRLKLKNKRKKRKPKNKKQQKLMMDENNNEQQSEEDSDDDDEDIEYDDIEYDDDNDNEWKAEFMGAFRKALKNTDISELINDLRNMIAKLGDRMKEEKDSYIPQWMIDFDINDNQLNGIMDHSLNELQQRLIDVKQDMNDNEMDGNQRLFHSGHHPINDIFDGQQRMYQSKNSTHYFTDDRKSFNTDERKENKERMDGKNRLLMNRSNDDNNDDTSLVQQFRNELQTLKVDIDKEDEHVPDLDELQAYRSRIRTIGSPINEISNKVGSECLNSVQLLLSDALQQMQELENESEPLTDVEPVLNVVEGLIEDVDVLLNEMNAISKENERKERMKDESLSDRDRLMINQRQLKDNAQSIENMMEDAKEHMNELHEKKRELYDYNHELNEKKEHMSNCQSLHDMLDRHSKDNETVHDDVDQSLVESQNALNNMKDELFETDHNMSALRSLLKNEHESTQSFIDELQDIRLKIAKKQIGDEHKSPAMEDTKSQTNAVLLPDLLALKDLRERIRKLQSDVDNDNEWLSESLVNCNHNVRTHENTHQKILNLQDWIHEFKRRPQRKLVQCLKHWNECLNGLVTVLKSKQHELSDFSLQKQNIRSECYHGIKEEFSVEEHKLNVYLQLMPNGRIEDRRAQMYDDEMLITEEGPIPQITDIMNDIRISIERVDEEIKNNFMNIRTQKLSTFHTMKNTDGTRYLLVDIIETKVPPKPSNDDEDSIVDDRSEHVQGFKMVHAQQFANCTAFDDSRFILNNLFKIRSLLGALSPLHYTVVSEFLGCVLDEFEHELHDLSKSYQRFMKNNSKENIIGDDGEMIAIEVAHYTKQLVQDLAADYHLNTNITVIKNNLILINAKILQVRDLRERDICARELRHLKQTYESYLDSNLLLPLPLNSEYDHLQSIEEEYDVRCTDPQTYSSQLAKDFTGLSDEQSVDNLRAIEHRIQDIERELYLLRAQNMNIGYNYVYEDGIIVGELPGDINDDQQQNGTLSFKQQMKYMNNSPLNINTLGLTFDEWNNISRNKQIELIQELMDMEYEYTGWIQQREDYVTQAALFTEEALYYRRLFTLPLEDFHIEKERQELFDGEISSQYRKWINGQKDSTEDPFMHIQSGMQRIHLKSNNPLENERLHQSRDEFNKEMKEVKDILSAHQRWDEQTSELVPEAIQQLCNEFEKYSNAYSFMSKRIEKLQNDNQRLDNELDDMQEEKDKLQEELQNERALLTNHKELEFEEKDVLEQLKDDLLVLRQDMDDAGRTRPIKDEYRNCRSAISNMCDPMSDLANDMDSETLRMAQQRLQHAIERIGKFEEEREQHRGPLADVIEEIIDEVDVLLSKQRGRNIPNQRQSELKKEVQSGSVFEHEVEGGIQQMRYPGIDLTPNDNNYNGDGGPGVRNDGRNKRGKYAHDPWPKIPNSFVKYTENFPKVIKIHIKGSWFNRVPKAEIHFNGSQINRKMADFRWLWRMLLLVTDVDRPVPDYPSDIPESHWPEGYLRRRKRELNLFLMQCHSIEWIKESHCYKNCFLAEDTVWKKHRDDHSNDMVQRVKNKKELYTPEHSFMIVD